MVRSPRRRARPGPTRPAPSRAAVTAVITCGTNISPYWLLDRAYEPRAVKIVLAAGNVTSAMPWTRAAALTVMLSAGLAAPARACGPDAVAMASRLPRPRPPPAPATPALAPVAVERQGCYSPATSPQQRDLVLLAGLPGRMWLVGSVWAGRRGRVCAGGSGSGDGGQAGLGYFHVLGVVAAADADRADDRVPDLDGVAAAEHDQAVDAGGR